MSVVGIVAEYNPFHNGHFYHLKEAKQITNSKNSIIVMSPNFVQRGGPAIIDKWTRTKIALLNGADLVIELPTLYASSSAEFFAQSSISLLEHCGIVDYLCFGSECDDLELLSMIAYVLAYEPVEFKNSLKTYLNTGISFPNARAKALNYYFENHSELSKYSQSINNIIQSPNNILGIEYIKALYRINSSIIPTNVKRVGSDYHNLDIAGNMPSATAIRNKISKGKWHDIAHSMPKSSYSNLYNMKERLIFYDDLSSFLSYRLIFSSPEDLKEILEVNEGIEHRVYKAFNKSHDINEITKLIKSKRLTHTAIRRMLVNIILQARKHDFKKLQSTGGVQYIRVLGFKESSSYLLGEISKKASLPLVINLAKDYKKLNKEGQQMLDFEIRASNIYSSLQASNKKSQSNYNLDYTQPIIKI